MKKVLAIALMLSAMVAFMVPAVAQEDIKSLHVEAFKPFERPASVFDHDKHAEDFGVDCGLCHHTGVENGKFVESDDPGAEACVDCHSVKPTKKDETNLRAAYHKMCIDCHLSNKKGPAACGQCHVNK
ncbi:MAG: acidic tetraheme cytochrome c3 TmcA [Desulfovibrio sp.]